MRYRVEYTLGLLSQVKNPIDEIKKAIRDVYKPLELFKMLIVIHECLPLSILDSAKIIGLLVEIQRQAKPK
jgi:hypothetical protein